MALFFIGTTGKRVPANPSVVVYEVLLASLAIGYILAEWKRRSDDFTLIMALVQTMAMILAIFAMMYWDIGSVSNFGISLSRIDAIYFSPGTLTTAGTGDIAAVSDAAKGLQMIQTVLSMALLVFAALRRGLERRAGALCEAAENGIVFQQQLQSLQEYLDGEILPHARAEERTLYPAAVNQARGGELARTLTAEHRDLAHLAGRLRPGTDGTEAATVSEQIATLFAGHVAKENDLLLPALTRSGADLAALLADMHKSQAGADMR